MRPMLLHARLQSSMPSTWYAEADFYKETSNTRSVLAYGVSDPLDTSLHVDEVQSLCKSITLKQSQFTKIQLLTEFLSSPLCKERVKYT